MMESKKERFPKLNTQLSNMVPLFWENGVNHNRACELGAESIYRIAHGISE